MGKGMMRNLAAKGANVFAYDTNPEAVKWAESLGALTGSTPAEIGEKCSVIFLSLPGPDVVREVVLGEAGLIDRLHPDAIIIDTSTIDPGTAKELHQRLQGKGARYYDCPVSGGPMGADQGTLTIMVGGDQEDLPMVLPYLQMIGKEILYMGESGAGQVAKLCHNAVVATITTVLGEVLEVGRKAGVDPEQLASVIDKGSAHNRVLSIFGPNIMKRTYDQVIFSLNHMHKDLSLYLDTAKAVATPSMVGSLVYQLYELAKSNGKGALDCSAVCG
jgi:3-hydroxyisobutyrate dehydrogenase-like beta-hydroxyacid dehydrogenase